MNFAIIGLLAALPPITSTTEALVQLKSPNKAEALANLKDACRGKYRRDLCDKPELAKQLSAVYKDGGNAVKKAALDTTPCFSAATFAPLIEAALADEDELVAYGAEVAARLEEPKLLSLLYDAMDSRKDRCLRTDLEAGPADVCVWLTYAPGALLVNADEAARKLAGARASEMLAAEHPKIREVAVETLASTRLPEFAPKIAELIEKEKKFAHPNGRALIDRFREREKTLKKGLPPKAL